MNPNFLGSLAIFSLVTVNAAQSQDYPIEPVGDVHNILPLWEQAKVMEKAAPPAQTNRASRSDDKRRGWTCGSSRGISECFTCHW